LLIAGKVVGIDLFDKPAISKAVYERIVGGLILDALELPQTGCQAEGSGILVQLYRLKAVRWQLVEPVIGMGEMFHARGDDGTLATALVLKENIIHLSMSAPI